MADQQLVAQNFDLGMRQDRDRSQLPRGAAWRMVDWIPQDGAPAMKRGGWGFGSADLNALSSSAKLNAIAWAPFPTRNHLVAVSNTRKLFRMGPGSAIDSSAGTLVDAAFFPAGDVVTQPFWHKDRVIFPTTDAGSDPRKYYDSGGGTFVTGAVGGTPPRAQFGFSYGDYVALGNGYDPGNAYALNSRRLWYSNVGAPDSYNTGVGGGFMDFPREIVGGVVMRTFQLIWGYEQLYIVSGSIPPPGGDFDTDILFNTGCFDQRSIATYREYAIWANQEGIFKTDGTTLTDLTKSAELSILWRSLVSNFNYSNGWCAAGGVLHGQYHCTITDSAGLNIATFVIDLENNTGWLNSNMKATMYAARVSAQGTSLEPGSDELFGAWRSGARVMRLAQIWTPQTSNRSDADGTAVLPVMETAFFKLGRTEEKRLRFAYVGYDLRDGGEGPQMVVGWNTSPELQTYTEPTGWNFPATTRFDRRRSAIMRRAEGVALRIRQTQPSAQTRLSEIELEGWPVEGSN
jgi:hypothetical protein